MLDRWWRAQAKLPERLDELPTAAQGCRIAELAHDEGETRTRAPGSPPEEGETVAAPAWWRAWKPHVFYAPAPAFTPGSAAPACEGGGCIALEDAAGMALGRDKQLAVVVARSPNECATPALDCNAARCRSARSGIPGHEVIVLP